MPSWNTFKPPLKWSNLQGIPTDFTDGKISWAEVLDKPSTFPHTPFWGLEFAENSVNILDFHVQGAGKNSMDFDARIACFSPTSSVSNSTATLQYQALNHWFYGSFFLFGLPSVPASANQVWRDSQGFLRI